VENALLWPLLGESLSAIAMLVITSSELFDSPVLPPTPNPRFPNAAGGMGPFATMRRLVLSTWDFHTLSSHGRVMVRTARQRYCAAHEALRGRGLGRGGVVGGRPRPADAPGRRRNGAASLTLPLPSSSSRTASEANARASARWPVRVTTMASMSAAVTELQFSLSGARRDSLSRTPGLLNRPGCVKAWCCSVTAVGWRLEPCP